MLVEALEASLEGAGCEYMEDDDFGRSLPARRSGSAPSATRLLKRGMTSCGGGRVVVVVVESLFILSFMDSFIRIRTRYHAAVGSSAALNSHAVLHSGHRLSLWDESHLLMHCRWNACEHTPKHTGDSSPGYRQSGAACSKAFRQIPQQSSFSPAFHVL